MTAPDPSGRGVVASVRQALQDVWPDEIGWIKTHGTGTRLNDAAEYRGLAALFGERLREIPLTSLKPMLGHCLGACGAVEAVAAILALGRGFIPRTLGTGSVDPEFAGCRVATRVESRLAETILLLFESFGGRCAALAVGRGQVGSDRGRNGTAGARTRPPSRRGPIPPLAPRLQRLGPEPDAPPASPHQPLN